MKKESINALRLWMSEVMVCLARCSDDIGTSQMEVTFDKYHEAIELLRQEQGGIIIKDVKPDLFKL